MQLYDSQTNVSEGRQVEVSKEVGSRKKQYRKSPTEEDRKAKSEYDKKKYPSIKAAKCSYLKEYYQKNKERIKASVNEYRNANLESIKTKRKSWYENNKEAVYRKCRSYIIKNREKVAAYHRKYRHKRRRADPLFDLALRLRSRLGMAIKAAKAKKAMRTFHLVGCTIQELRQHIESHFLPDMTWENRHLWHVDHIKPVSSFDLKYPDQQALCFHYSNLQPLWGEDNMKKGSKILDSQPQ